MTLAARDAPLRWDYTLTDVERLTQDAARYTLRRVGMDYEDQYAAAYHGVVLALYDTEQYPARRELFWAGVDAIFDEANLIYNARGQRRNNGYVEECGSAPRFAQYWSQHVTPFPEDAILERVALPQVLARLTAQQYDILTTVATHPSMAASAASLGIPVGTVKARLFEIRALITRLWMEGETPTVHRRADSAQVCRFGHPRAQFGVVSSSQRLDCLKCKAQRKARRRAKGLVA